jgi:hypothetical protein
MRTPGNKTILLIFCALAALAIAGCGGGGEETETTTPTVEEPAALTKDELIEQGDGVCAEVNAAVGALSGSETPETTPGESTEKIANLYVGMVERQEAAAALESFQSQAAIYGFEDCSDEPGLPTPAGGEGAPGGEPEIGGVEEGGVEVEPELEEPAPEEEIVPEEEVAPETGGAGGGPEAPEPAPETGGESGGVGPG